MKRTTIEQKSSKGDKNDVTTELQESAIMWAKRHHSIIKTKVGDNKKSLEGASFFCVFIYLYGKF